MKKDCLIGPPKEIFEKEENYLSKLKQRQHMKRKNEKAKKAEDTESEDDMNAMIGIEGNSEDVNAYNQNKLRKYEL